MELMPWQVEYLRFLIENKDKKVFFLAPRRAGRSVVEKFWREHMESKRDS